MAEVSVSTQGAEEWQRLASKLREAANGGLRSAMRERIQSSARPLLSELKNSAMQLPSHHGNPDGLREKLVRGTSLEVTPRGVRFVASARPFGPTGSNMPRRVNTGVWRHPVFGNRKAWVGQKMPAGWFSDPLKKSTPRFRRAVLDAMDDTKRKLEER